MGAILDLVAYPLGWIMWLLYSFIPNYGVVILAFTLITKVLLFPISLHQHKSIIARTRLQPQLADLKNKYGKNPQKYQEEMLALYKREGINPASGCGVQFIQFPILFGILGIIYAPLKYILHLSDELILKATEITNRLLDTDILTKSNVRGEQYTIIKTLKANPTAFKSLGQDVIDKVSGLKFSFLGMDLSKAPSVPHSFVDIDWLLLIPILSGLTSLWISLQSVKNSSKTAIDDNAKQAFQSVKMMSFIMPLFSVWFSFKFPAGVGLYWIFSNVFIAIQSKILYTKYDPAEIVARAQEEITRKKEQERKDRIEAKKKLINSEYQQGDDIYKTMSQKEINKLKLASARKRDAEKYGDYNE